MRYLQQVFIWDIYSRYSYEIDTAGIHMRYLLTYSRYSYEISTASIHMRYLQHVFIWDIYSTYLYNWRRFVFKTLIYILYAGSCMYLFNVWHLQFAILWIIGQIWGCIKGSCERRRRLESRIGATKAWYINPSSLKFIISWSSNFIKQHAGREHK